jgi:glycosyltransferase involved in cell wall biosynthesis
MAKTLAIFSPGQNAYSETFIHAHKKLPFNIKYYYGGTIPFSLEGKNISEFSFSEKWKRKILRGNFTSTEKLLISSLRKEKVDCVLAEYGTTAADSLHVINYLKIPLIVHFHGYDASQKDVIKQYGEKYKDVFAHASKVIVVSKRMYKDVMNLGCPESKLVLNSYGPDDFFFKIRAGFNNQQFVSVGRFVEKKAPLQTINAFKKVVNGFPEAKLIMAGDGELLEESKDFAESLGLQNNITFPGALNREQVRQLFSSSIAFVQHSVVAENGDSEGTPVAILEAQAAGLPVISTFHAGIPDVVINEETGLLVEENDVEGMANNMIRILKEENLAQKLGNAGRERVKGNFAMERHLKILEKEIENSILN